MEPLLTALILPVPEAEPVVAAHRARLDRAASWGVPAHVTVMFPFLPPERVDEPVRAALRRLAAGTPAFAMTLERLGWFQERVVWLAPEPAGPVVGLIEAVSAEFGVRPYGGEHAEVVPHLTIGHDQPVEQLRAAGQQVVAAGPVRARAGTLRLITGRRVAGGTWTTVEQFPLG